jgi:protein involved in polysaccharide export with SLBB domain
LVGTLPAAARTVADLERTLAQKLRTYVSSPQVRISIKQFAENNVFVMGKAVRPGPVSYRPGLKLLAAVSESGGFSDDADRTAIKVYRGKGGDRVTQVVNAQEILASGDLSKDFTLEPGDIVEVQRGGNSVSVLGMVMKPGAYAFREKYTLLELISEAGGLAMGAKTSRIYVYRPTADGREALWVNLGRVMKGHPEEDIELGPGDIVMVPQKPLYAGTGATTAILTPWFYLATLVLAVVITTRGRD